MWNTYLNGRVNIPGPIPWPIVGNLPMLLRTKNPNILFLELKMKYGNIVYFTLGSQPFVLCFGFKLIHDVLVKYGDKTKFRPLWLRSFVKLFKGQTSLVFSNGQEWVAGRKFTAAALKDFGVGTKSIEERIHEETRYLIDFFSKSQNSSIDASKLFPKVASNVVSISFSGERFDHEDPEFIRLLENVQFIIEQNSPFRPDNFFPILEVFRTTNQLQAAVERFNETKECIRRRIDKQRLTFDPCVIRNFLDLYLAQEGKQDSKISAPMAVPHTTLEDIYIEGKLIPKKSILLCDLMSVHLDPIVWNEPDIFRPERFLDDKGHFLRSENFCPFSLGPRQCVGKHLGEAELFLIFTSLLQRFDLIKANPDQTLSTEGKQTFAYYSNNATDEQTKKCKGKSIQSPIRKSTRLKKKPARFEDESFTDPGDKTVSSDENRFYKVKRILARKIMDGTMSYLVHFIGEPAQNARWLKESDFDKKTRDLIKRRLPPQIL
ncbi:unnamed protein product [Mytilus edulis]|uniref:Uncharacterized protein n=1 Tax=Mytilus edulis TaxID=6550 RepID=A0A8S3TKC0_MYTED|nr:unnamed protein product [Mytilus edulis]